MPYKFNPFTRNLDYYEAGGNTIVETPVNSGDNIDFTISVEPTYLTLYRGGVQIESPLDYRWSGTNITLSSALDVANGETLSAELIL